MENGGAWKRFQDYRHTEPDTERASAFEHGLWRWFAEDGPKRAGRDALAVAVGFVVLWVRSGWEVAEEEAAPVIAVLVTILLFETGALVWYLATAASKQRDKLRCSLREERRALEVYERPARERTDEELATREHQVGRLKGMLSVRAYLLDAYDEMSTSPVRFRDWEQQAERAVSDYSDDIRRLHLPQLAQTKALASSRETTREIPDTRGFGFNHPGHALAPLAQQEVGLRDALDELEASAE